MKLNWNKFISNLYSWEVVANEFTCFESSVRHVEGKKYGKNVDGCQILERVWDMHFIDFLKARELVRKHNKKHIMNKYKIRYIKLI